MRVNKRDFGTIRLLPPLDIKRADGAAGTFEGYASVFGAVDSFGERVERGAFAESLARHKADGTAVLMLWGHDPGEPIGTWDELTEDDTGLYVRGRLLTGVQRADEARVLLKAKAVSGLSIGFRVAPDGRRLNGDGTVSLTKIDLLEISIVAMPALSVARVTHAKAEHFDTREDFERHLRESGLPGGMAKKTSIAAWPTLREDGACCSFCARPRAQVKGLVEGTAAFICDECIEEAAELAAASMLDLNRINSAFDLHAKALAVLRTKGT